MTASELQIRLKLVATRVSSEIGKNKIIPMLDLHANYYDRIFVKGKTATGQKIGRYSTNPSYISIKGQKKRTGSQISNSRLTPKGKNGKSKFKNGKVKKSRYMANGYSEFRSTVGRQNNYVDLNLSGNLASSFGLNSSKNSVKFGFTNREQTKLAAKLEGKYGKNIFGVSKKEKEKVISLSRKMIRESVIQALKGK